MTREYPHLLFRRHWSLTPKATYELGQCDALISAISETPIEPSYHRKLLNVSLTKGALATTAIEGNTLTIAEVEKVAQGKKLPPSKEYQEIEVRNVLSAMNEILREVAIEAQEQLVSPELVLRFHRMIGQGLGEHLDAIPGRFRTDERTVGPYRCPDHEDVPALIDRLCEWLKSEFAYSSGRQTFADAVVQAIVSHVYLEWIHSFGDGNGRTGRLLEFYILLRSGNPDIGSHILSNHYNLTRPEYYRQIQVAFEKRDLTQFIQYAVEGFRDGLRATLHTIQMNQFETAWRSFIYDKFADRPYTKRTVFKRRRDLMLAVPVTKDLSESELMLLTPELARTYAKLSARTFARDIDVLKELGLLVENHGSYSANANALRHNLARRINRDRAALTVTG